MAFRAVDSAEQTSKRAYSKLLEALPPQMRDTSRLELERILDELGPVVDSYPIWHPLVIHQKQPTSPTTTPSVSCGYRGLDHTVFLRNGFITCPYGGGEEVLDSIAALPRTFNFVAEIEPEVLPYKLYSEDAIAILVRCRWNLDQELHMSLDGTIPLRTAIGLLLETEIPAWRWSQYGETWQTMREYFLGRPCGKRSSLFVNEKTGSAMKKVWKTIIETGVFGPLKVG